MQRRTRGDDLVPPPQRGVNQRSRQGFSEVMGVMAPTREALHEVDLIGDHSVAVMWLDMRKILTVIRSLFETPPQAKRQGVKFT